jgi:hypothetical protein
MLDFGMRNDYNERRVFLFFVVGQYLLSSYVCLLNNSELFIITVRDTILNTKNFGEFCDIPPCSPLEPRRHIPEDRALHNLRCENYKYHRNPCLAPVMKLWTCDNPAYIRSLHWLNCAVFYMFVCVCMGARKGTMKERIFSFCCC